MEYRKSSGAQKGCSDTIANSRRNLSFPDDEEFNVEEIKGSITRRKRVLYHVKWLGLPKKKDWTFESYENFSEGAWKLLLEFHRKHPNAPRDYRLKESGLPWCPQ